MRATTIVLVLILLAIPFILFSRNHNEIHNTISARYLVPDPIPVKYTCHGKDTSPPIFVEAKGKGYLAIELYDPDAPSGTWVHWLAWDIPINGNLTIPEGYRPEQEGKNSWGFLGYKGPCPPNGRHRYVLKVCFYNQPMGSITGKQVLSSMKRMECSEDVRVFG